MKFASEAHGLVFIPNDWGMTKKSHHKEAYKALWKSLQHQDDILERRKQLDSWLKMHQKPLAQGAVWEKEFTGSNLLNSEAFWQDEYQQVALQAVRNGFFYSDAFQKQLFHMYVETGRLTLKQLERSNCGVTQQSTKNLKSSAGLIERFSWLFCILLFVPLLIVY